VLKDDRTHPNTAATLLHGTLKHISLTVLETT